MSEYKQRLDQAVAQRKLTTSRSQAESWIKLGKVYVNGQAISKPGFLVYKSDTIELDAQEQYVSRAGLKLASVAGVFGLSFIDRTVLDVGSSTGGFTDYALKNGAKKVYAVDVGTDQLHPSLRGHPRIELHEKTDIRDFTPSDRVDIVVIDVSFISLRDILPHVHALCTKKTEIIAMVKPQFEAGREQVSKGVIKNERVRRDILNEFEQWARQSFIIKAKRDSGVAGTKGNQERFYLLKKM